MSRFIKLADGSKIPALGWGNGSQGLGSSGQTAIDLGASTLRAGIRHIDTAQSYHTERETGEAIAKSGLSRDEVWVTTKVSGTSKTKTTAEDVKRSVQESIARLGFIPNMLLIHNPFVPEKGKISEFWTYLEALVHDGTLKGCSLGFSNFRPQDIEDVMRVATIKPVCHQLEYHPYVLKHLEPIEKLHAQYDIVVESFGPLTPILRHPGGPLRPVLDNIAKRLGTDAASVLLRWTIQKGVVAVTTATRQETINKLAALDQVADLTDEEVKQIDDVGRTVHFRHYTEHMTEDFPNPDLPDGK